MSRIWNRFRLGALSIGTTAIGYSLATTCFAEKDLILTQDILKPDNIDYESIFKSLESKLATPTEVSRRQACERVYESTLPMDVKMETLVTDIQHRMTSILSLIDGTPFTFDKWIRKEGGYGTSAVLQSGTVFEKAGVNVSIIRSEAPKAMLSQMRARKSLDVVDGEGYDMFVAGVSMVTHPINPHAPTFHANYRYFELFHRKSGEKVCSWFGGGCDLTPCYLYENDATWFHQLIKKACDGHDLSYYPKFKKWCDEYFNNTHRGERRGIGGIFFDDLENQENFGFVKDAGLVLMKQYAPIVYARKDMKYTPMEKEWQQIRRGRYVEFNLYL